MGEFALSTDAWIVSGVALAYLAGCLWVGMRGGSGASDSALGYVAGDRALGPLVMYFIIGATVFSAFSFLATPGLALTSGAAVFYVLGYGLVGFIPFYFLGPRAARLGRSRGYITQAEMVAGECRHAPLAGTMALVSALSFIPYLALQIKGAGLVVNRLTEGQVPEWLGSAVCYVVVLAYVLKSGVLGVGWTNVFQGVLMMALAWAFGLWLPYKLYGGVGPMFEQIAAAKPEVEGGPLFLSAPGAKTWTWFLNSGVISMIGFVCWPHLFMKAFSARDERTLRRTVVFYPTFMVFLVPIFLIGFAGVLFPSQPASPEQILPHMLMSLDLPALVVGLFCAGALAAGMSTGDAIVHASASILVRDGWITALRRPLTSTQERTAVRVLIVVLMLASYALAVLYDGDLVSLLLYAYGPIAQFLPGLLVSLLGRRRDGVALHAALVVGVVVCVSLKMFPESAPWGVHEGLCGLAANVVVLLALSFARGWRPFSASSGSNAPA
ncbi:MAG: sodium:solute symporter family protein [Planctomycetes bacterium]|nr:sodium:solute symporter family protein [Planctomycetota bacterium]